MDIEDAFTTEAIAAAGTNIDGEDDEYLRNLILRIFASNEFEQPSDNDVRVAALCFVAGRTYQSDLDSEVMIEIPMTPDEVHEYIAYLAQKGQS
jgi:hypothetical protein